MMVILFTSPFLSRSHGYSTSYAMLIINKLCCFGLPEVRPQQSRAARSRFRNLESGNTSSLELLWSFAGSFGKALLVVNPIRDTFCHKGSVSNGAVPQIAFIVKQDSL